MRDAQRSHEPLVQADRLLEGHRRNRIDIAPKCRYLGIPFCLPAAAMTPARREHRRRAQAEYQEATLCSLSRWKSELKELRPGIRPGPLVYSMTCPVTLAEHKNSAEG